MNVPQIETASAVESDARASKYDSLIVAKTELRRRMKARLNSLVVDRNQVAAAILRNLETLDAFRKAETLAVYLDFGSEAPTRPVVSQFFQRAESSSGRPCARRVAVPFCDGDELRFYRIDAPTFEVANRPFFLGLEPRTFGILEPTAALRSDPSRRVAPNEFDVVLVPGLAFDRNGGRLGRGAGYYDRFLSKLSSNARLIGVAFDEQIVERVPTSTLDVPVWAVATPSTILGGVDK